MGAKAKREAKNDDTTTSTTVAEELVVHRKGMTSFGKFVLFLVFPFVSGITGLLTSYMERISHPEHKIRIERDFAFPFAVALLLTVVIVFQTVGFTMKPQPLLRWPKVRKARTVRHVHVVKGQDTKKASETSDDGDVDDRGEKQDRDKKDD